MALEFVLLVHVEITRVNLARVINTFNGQSTRLWRGNMCNTIIKNKDGMLLNISEKTKIMMERFTIQ